jgi:hypothetical protein
MAPFIKVDSGLVTNIIQHPKKMKSGMGTGAVLAAGEKLHFPFYAKSDNMIAVP